MINWPPINTPRLRLTGGNNSRYQHISRQTKVILVQTGDVLSSQINYRVSKKNQFLLIVTFKDFYISTAAQFYVHERWNFSENITGAVGEEGQIEEIGMKKALQLC